MSNSLAAQMRSKFAALSTATNALVKAEGEQSAAVAAGFRCAAELAQKRVKAEERYNKRRQQLWDAVFEIINAKEKP